MNLISLRQRMRISNLALQLLSTLCLLWAALGCSRQSKEPDILPTAAVTASIENNFKNADAEAIAIAKDGVAALQSNDLTSAYEHFKALSDRGGLTKEQRMAASAAFVNILKEASAAAEQGDPKAKEIMKAYMMSK